jgi:hypothetical protein
MTRLDRAARELVIAIDLQRLLATVGRLTPVDFDHLQRAELEYAAARRETAARLRAAVPRAPVAMTPAGAARGGAGPGTSEGLAPVRLH